MKKQATTRFQGDDLVILARLHSIGVKKSIESQRKLVRKQTGYEKEVWNHASSRLNSSS